MDASWEMFCTSHKKRKRKFSHQRQDSEKKTRMQWNRNFSDNSYLEWEVAKRIFHRQRRAKFFHAATLITLLPIKFKLMRRDENWALKMAWVSEVSQGGISLWYSHTGHSHLPRSHYTDYCRSSCCRSRSGYVRYELSLMSCPLIYSSWLQKIVAWKFGHLKFSQIKRVTMQQ